MNKLNVAVGTEEEFFKRGKAIAAAADAGETIKQLHSITFENVEDLLACMTPKRLVILEALRKSSGSITSLAERVHRDRSAVSRDLAQLQRAGIVKVETQPSQGHGSIKMVHAIAHKIDLHVAI